MHRQPSRLESRPNFVTRGVSVGVSCLGLSCRGFHIGILGLQNSGFEVQSLPLLFYVVIFMLSEAEKRVIEIAEFEAQNLILNNAKNIINSYP